MSKIVFGATPILKTTIPATGQTFEVQSVDRVFQLDLHGVGASAVVAIDVSLTGDGFAELYSIEIADANLVGRVTACLASSENFSFVRARVVSISDGAFVTVFAGD